MYCAVSKGVIFYILLFFCLETKEPKIQDLDFFAKI